MLVSGDLAAMPAITEELIAALPLEPGRIVLPTRGPASTARANGDDRTALGAYLPARRFAGIGGAYLAGQAGPGLEAFDRVVRAIGRDGSTVMPAPSVDVLLSGGADPLPRVLVAASAALAVDAERAMGGEA